MRTYFQGKYFVVFPIRFVRIASLFFIYCFSLIVPDSRANDLLEYFPVEDGRTLHYERSKTSLITTNADSRKSKKNGTVVDRIINNSDSSMITLRRLVKERNSSLGNVSLESELHLRIEPTSIAIVGMKIIGSGQPLQQFSVPRPILQVTLPGPWIEDSLGTLTLKTQLVSLWPSNTETPAGKFSDCLRTESKGYVLGSLMGFPVEKGTIVTKSWFARGVGLVREDRTIQLEVNTPNGDSIYMKEVGIKHLLENPSE